MKEGYVDINVVLDRSGSMDSVLEPTISGYNEFLNSQKGQAGEAKFTLAQFDDVYEIVYAGVSVEDVPELDRKTFVPRNTTALNDAIGKTITETGNRLNAMRENERPEKVIFVIITDGGENASREYTSDKVQDMITHQRNKYNWEFIFIGANQDAIATAKGFGIGAGNALNYTANAVGSTYLYQDLGAKLTRSRRVGLSTLEASESLTFNDEDRKKQEDAKSS